MEDFSDCVVMRVVFHTEDDCLSGSFYIWIYVVMDAWKMSGHFTIPKRNEAIEIGEIYEIYSVSMELYIAHEPVKLLSESEINQ